MVADFLFSFGCGLDLAGAMLLASSSFIRPSQRVAVSGDFWGANWYARTKATHAVVEARSGLVSLVLGFALLYSVGLWSMAHNVPISERRAVLDAAALAAGIAVTLLIFRITRDYFARKVALSTAWYVSPKLGRWKRLSAPSVTQLAFHSIFSGEDALPGEEVVEYVKRLWSLSDVTDDIDSFDARIVLADLLRAQRGIDLDDPDDPAQIAR